MIVKQLSGHVSKETAYVVDDYPYGFRLRCKIRYWIESNKRGDRFCSQTTNPKKAGEVWNKPKASTYSPVLVMGLNDIDHVEFGGVSQYGSDEEVAKFEARFELTEAQKVTIKVLKLLNAHYNSVLKGVV